MLLGPDHLLYIHDICKGPVFCFLFYASFILQYNGPPTGYIQQVVVKATVAPWQVNQMIPIDAFRAPLGKVFEVIDGINNFKSVQG